MMAQQHPSKEGRTLVFTGASHNSLVVLPLALALPAAFDLTPAVVVP
jgi:ACR3 family arsenite efflux pump ArsB